MYARAVLPRILDALADTPAVFIKGARQVGKSTLAREIAGRHHPAAYITFDDALTYSMASADPQGFLTRQPTPIVIDEVQRVPDIFRAIKLAVDENRQPGRFLLTGSADVLALPMAADALVGRMEAVTLWPLTQAEIAGRTSTFLERLFDPGVEVVAGEHADQAMLARMVEAGGYPEALGKTGHRRDAWFGSYLGLVLDREVRDLHKLQDVTALPKLLKLLAARTSSLFNQSEVSRSAAMPNATIGRYLAILQALFLAHFLPAWSSNFGKRLVKSPKLILPDTGLACSLLGVGADRLLADPDLAGKLFETFVASEIVKLSGALPRPVQPGHFRSLTGQEVDLVIEDHQGRLCAVEVKWGVSPSPKDFSGMARLAAELGDRFVKGVILHTGATTAPFGDKFSAVPVTALWS
jgi:hypothetical protein